MIQRISKHLNPYGQRWSYVASCYLSYGMFYVIGTLRWILILLGIVLLWAIDQKC